MPAHYRRSSAPTPLFLKDYPTRVLIGLLGSLGILLFVLHIPVIGSSEPGNWSSPKQAWLPIGKLASAEDPDEVVSEEEISSKSENAPPPTNHGPPVEGLRAEKTSNTSDNGEGSTERDQDEKTGRRETVSITQLASNDFRPELIGGKGSLYLHINYPYEARMQGVEGRLMLQFTVTKKGRVRNVEVEESLHPLCDSAAVEGIRSVRFRPAQQQGETVPVRMSLPVRFEIQKPDTSSLRTNLPER